jgi:hypothetical protein
MDELQQELAKLKLDLANPYMQCLAGLLEPPTKKYLANLISYYESILPTTSGIKREVVEKMLANLKKKI